MYIYITNIDIFLRWVFHYELLTNFDTLIGDVKLPEDIIIGRYNK